MKHRNIIILITFIVLLFLLIYPTAYIQIECSEYLKNIDAVKAAIENRDADMATRLSEEKLLKWDGNNVWILAFTPHAETEFIKKSVIELSYSIRQKKYDLALEKADILYSQIDHLIQTSRLSLENLF